jgi:hypothetical protein
MHSMTRLSRLALMSMLCLSLVVLMSCAHETRRSPPSSSVIVKETASDALAKQCNALKPERIPETATVEWINHAARAAQRWQSVCGAP